MSISKRVLVCEYEYEIVTLKRDLELVMGDADQEKCWSQNYKLKSESLHLFFPVLQFPYDYLRVSKASVVRAQPRKEDVLFLREVQVPIQEVPELCQTLRGCLGVPAASKCQDAIQAYSGCTPVPALEDCFLQNQEFCFPPSQPLCIFMCYLALLGALSLF